MSAQHTTSGKIYDPVFLFMLVAVFLALASSFALRAVVSGVGPKAARAASVTDGQSRDSGAADQLQDSPDDNQP
ncbi:MAG TPA: hypothetical protein VH253_16060 [Phycisphaerae bacterium]|nr:hypothetical protein [Phycisphaerae bacterium]